MFKTFPVHESARLRAQEFTSAAKAAIQVSYLSQRSSAAPPKFFTELRFPKLLGFALAQAEILTTGDTERHRARLSPNVSPSHIPQGILPIDRGTGW